MTQAENGGEPEGRETVRITVLLEGGHRETATVFLDDPQLEALMQQLGAPHAGLRLLQIPVRDGQAMLAVRSDRIVGVLSEPPMQMDLSDTPAQAPPIERAQVFVRNDFLPPEQLRRVYAYALQNASRFVETSTSSRDRGYRQSEVLFDFPDIAEDIRARIRAMLPEVQAALGCAPLSSTIEAQMTAHNDGNYYKVHNDNGSEDTARRELTFVYYFHGQPKRFTGGELRVFDSVIRERRYVAAESSQLVTPDDNRIVFFLSRYLHEVQEIRCPSHRFEDGRFTINGWVHKL